jgi:hypothetical protein
VDRNEKYPSKEKEKLEKILSNRAVETLAL